MELCLPTQAVLASMGLQQSVTPCLAQVMLMEMQASSQWAGAGPPGCVLLTAFPNVSHHHTEQLHLSPFCQGAELAANLPQEPWPKVRLGHS